MEFQYGYNDWRDSDGVWHYYGAGQTGDMKMVRGNKALRDHSINGKDLHLFQSIGRGKLRYVGQYVCSEYDEVLGEPDGDGASRKAFVFSLVPFGAVDVIDHFDPDPGSGRNVWEIPMTELRAATVSSATLQGHAPASKRKVYQRSERLKVYVRRRANGHCEGCGEPGPFVTKRDGEPYLEPHHTTRIADGGPDHPAHVIALCPSCHRRVHHGVDGVKYNEQLKKKLRKLEGSNAVKSSEHSATKVATSGV